MADITTTAQPCSHTPRSLLSIRNVAETQHEKRKRGMHLRLNRFFRVHSPRSFQAKAGFATSSSRINSNAAFDTMQAGDSAEEFV